MGINLYIENLEIPAKMPLKIFFLDLAYGIIGPRRVPIFSWLTSRLAFGFYPVLSVPGRQSRYDSLINVGNLHHSR